MRIEIIPTKTVGRILLTDPDVAAVLGQIERLGVRGVGNRDLEVELTQSMVATAERRVCTEIKVPVRPCRCLKARRFRVYRVSVAIEGRRLVNSGSAEMDFQTDFDMLLRIVHDVVAGRQISGSEIHLTGMRRIDGIGVDNAKPMDGSILIPIF